MQDNIKYSEYLGLWTLYKKEVRRFLKVYNQTLLAPIVTNLLFLAVFSLAVGDRIRSVGDVSFGMFMASGLVMMSIVQQAFANSSSSFVMGKVLGNIIDILMPPIRPSEIVLAYVGGAITRGIIVGVLGLVTIQFFVDITLYDPLLMLLFAVLAACMLGLLGIFTGILSDSFDQMAAITSYVITPLSFLSGTFYSVNNLPAFWYHVSQYNPFFYMIDGFRYAMTGYSDADYVTGILVLSAANLVLWVSCQVLIARGWRIKS